MADIKPIQFPTVHHEPRQPAVKSRPVQPSRKVEKSPLHELFLNSGQARATGKSKLNHTKQMSAKMLLDAKALTLKLYQQNKTVPNNPVKLGQIIDVKV